ncbi:hypothetical protein EJ06DRAFT_525602 [Trichodelitschia bisporula]|uniref:LisH domain-containing protein n=1 Tax=Trichodelitschia bisporula TaxID=703511 RepID=A0A6G1IA07_9PEZI|nr:hypothetical protein EJ06DRAFT_525602 [Trichodelitschia bisporula]
MAIEALTTNALNFVIFKYLQDAGYRSAAERLRREWLGSEGHPEHLPFASNVPQHCLINMAQDAMFLDHLESRAKQIPARYVFSGQHTVEHAAIHPGLDENAPEAALRSSTTSQAPEAHPHTEDGTSPAAEPQRKPSRKRKTPGASVTNGDVAMEDVNGHAPMPAEEESPAPVVEETPPATTLDTGHSRAIYTHEPRNLNQDTTLLDVLPDRYLERLEWMPYDPGCLLSMGKGYLRLNRIDASSAESGLEHKSVDVALPAQLENVDAFCWTTPNCAVAVVNSGGPPSQMRTQLYALTNWCQTSQLLEGPPLPGLVTSLAYSKSSNLLLYLACARTNVVRVYDVQNNYRAGAFMSLEGEFEEAAWISDTKFVLTGGPRLRFFELTPGNEDIKELEPLQSEHAWRQVKWDPLSGLVALVDQSRTVIGILNSASMTVIHTSSSQPPAPPSGQQNGTSRPTKITAFAFQPIPNPAALDPATPRLLATSLGNGIVHLWAAASLDYLGKLSMDGLRDIQAIDFSPDGFYLAAAGSTAMGVWRADDNGQLPKATWNALWAEETRRIASADEWCVNLAWDANGKKIAVGFSTREGTVEYAHASVVRLA